MLVVIVDVTFWMLVTTVVLVLTAVVVVTTDPASLTVTKDVSGDLAVIP